MKSFRNFCNEIYDIKMKINTDAGYIISVIL